MVEKRISWVASDGCTFEREKDAVAYEASLEKVTQAQVFLTDVLQCSDRKRSEYLSVLNQYFLWSSDAWQALQPKLDVPKPEKAQPEIIRPAKEA